MYAQKYFDNHQKLDVYLEQLDAYLAFNHQTEIINPNSQNFYLDSAIERSFRHFYFNRGILDAPLSDKYYILDTRQQYDNFQSDIEDYTCLYRIAHFLTGEHFETKPTFDWFQSVLKDHLVISFSQSPGINIFLFANAHLFTDLPKVFVLTQNRHAYLVTSDSDVADRFSKLTLSDEIIQRVNEQSRNDFEGQIIGSINDSISHEDVYTYMKHETDNFNDRLVLDHQLHRTKNGLYYLRQKDPKYLFEIGSNRQSIKISNSPDGACGYYSIFKMIKPSTIEQWTQLLYVFIDVLQVCGVNTRPLRNNITECWKKQDPIMPFGSYLCQIYNQYVTLGVGHWLMITEDQMNQFYINFHDDLHVNSQGWVIGPNSNLTQSNLSKSSGLLKIHMDGYAHLVSFSSSHSMARKEDKTLDIESVIVQVMNWQGNEDSNDAIKALKPKLNKMASIRQKSCKRQKAAQKQSKGAKIAQKQFKNVKDQPIQTEESQYKTSDNQQKTNKTRVNAERRLKDKVVKQLLKDETKNLPDAHDSDGLVLKQLYDHKYRDEELTIVQIQSNYQRDVLHSFYKSRSTRYEMRENAIVPIYKLKVNYNGTEIVSVMFNNFREYLRHQLLRKNWLLKMCLQRIYKTFIISCLTFTITYHLTGTVTCQKYLSKYMPRYFPQQYSPIYNVQQNEDILELKNDMTGTIQTRLDRTNIVHKLFNLQPYRNNTILKVQLTNFYPRLISAQISPNMYSQIMDLLSYKKMCFDTISEKTDQRSFTLRFIKGQLNITVNQKGPIPPCGISFLRQFPLYQTSLKVSKEFTNSHGGHPFGRYVNDIMHSHNLKLLYKQAYLMRDQQLEINIVIPGSKFISQMAIFDQMFRFDLSRHFLSKQQVNDELTRVQDFYLKHVVRRVSGHIQIAGFNAKTFYKDALDLFNLFNFITLRWILVFCISQVDKMLDSIQIDKQQFIDLIAYQVNVYLTNQKFLQIARQEVSDLEYKSLKRDLVKFWNKDQMVKEFIDFVEKKLYNLKELDAINRDVCDVRQNFSYDINDPKICFRGLELTHDPVDTFYVIQDSLNIYYTQPLTINVYHVRPCESLLDKEYYSTYVEDPDTVNYERNGIQFKSLVRQNMNHTICQCTLQDFEEAIDTKVDFYLINDVHYYLSDVKLKSSEAIVYTSGTNHNITPGTYRYFFGDGTFKVYIKDNISHMNQLSRGQGKTYSHPVVHLEDPSTCIPFGWWTAFSDSRKAESFNRTLKTFTNIDIYPTDMSIQDTFLYVNSVFNQIPDPTLQRQVAEYRGNSFYRYYNNTIYPEQLGNSTQFGPIQGNQSTYDHTPKFGSIRFQNSAEQQLYIDRLTYSLKMQVDQIVSDPSLDVYVSAKKCIQLPWNRHILNNKIEIGHPFAPQAIEKIQFSLLCQDIDVHDKIVVKIDDQQLNQIMYNGISLENTSDDLHDVGKKIYNGKTQDYSQLHIENYYKCDMLGPEKRLGLLDPNPNVIKDIKEYNDFGPPAALRLLQKLENQLGEGAIVFDRKTKRYEIFSDSKAKAIKTGFDIVDNSEKAHSQFEFCTTVIQNKIATLYRQMSGQIPVDQKYFDCYKKVTDDVNAYILKELKSEQMYDEWCEDFNIIQFFKDQDQWPKGKRQKYIDKTTEQLKDDFGGKMTGCIMLNVKSGEVHTEGADTEIPNVINSSKRGRTYGCVSQQRAGALVALQQIPIKACKMVWKDFIHGMGHGELISRMQCQRGLEKKTRKFCKVISADGSAYDSTQYKDNQREGEIKFVKLMKPYFYKVLMNKHNSDLWKGRDIDDVWKQIIDSWEMEFDYGFMKMDQVECEQWSDKVINLFRTDFPLEYKLTNERPWEHYIYIKFYGTTNSGKDLETTFGNTYKNLCYFYTYMRYHRVSNECWIDDRIYCMASGDDLIVLIFDSLIAAMVFEAFRKSTSTESNTQDPVGMGQCVKQDSMTIGSVNSIEFCSKWFFSPTESLDDIDYCRNMKKLMTTKSHYTGKNIYLMRDASLHRVAILQGIQSEKVSRMIEDMMQVCVNRLRSGKSLTEKDQYLVNRHEAVRYATKNEDHYNLELFVNQKLGLQLSDFLTIYWNNKYIYNGQGSQISTLIQDIHGHKQQKQIDKCPEEKAVNTHHNKDFVKRNVFCSGKKSLLKNLLFFIIAIFSGCLPIVHNKDILVNKTSVISYSNGMYEYYDQDLIYLKSDKRLERHRFENNNTKQNDTPMQPQKQNKNRKFKNTNYSMLSDLSQILQDQRRHLADNKPIEQQEVDRLNLKNLEDRLNSFEQVVIETKQKLGDSDIKTIIKKLEENDSVYLKAVDEMKELMQPLRGMSRASAIAEGVDVQTWAQLQEMQREHKLVLPNMVIQNKVKAGLLPLEAGTGSGKDLRTLMDILTQEGVDVREYQDDLPTFRAILMLNDWRSIARDLGQKMFSYAQQNVGKESVGRLLHAVSPAVYEVVQKISRELPKYIDYGADSGIWVGDQSSKVDVMDKKYTVPGFNEFFAGIPRNLVGSESMLSVDYNFLATFICPQSFGYREPQDYPLKTALIHNTQTLQLSTNANGEALFMINPDLPARQRVVDACLPTVNAPGENQSWSSFWAVDFSSLVATNSDLITGTLQTYSSAANGAFVGLKDGPLTDVRSQISQYKTTGFSVSIKPVSSELNNSGTIHFAYFPRSAIQAVNNNQLVSPTQQPPPIAGQSLGLNAIDTAPYHQQGNFKSGYRFNHIPHPQKYPKSQSDYSGFGDVDELYVIAATGCEPNSVVGSIEVSYVYEYIPVFTSQLMAIRTYPQLGSRSGDFASNMIQKYPAIMSMVEEDAYELASRIHRAKDNTAQGNEQILEQYFTRNH